MALPYYERPVDNRPVHTTDLPDTPQRDRTIVATAWIESPPELVHLGEDLGYDQVDYKRRIGRWLLWRSGPANHADARYMAVAADDVTERFAFRLFTDGTGTGEGPSGRTHTRFREWKEDLRDHGGG